MPAARAELTCMYYLIPAGDQVKSAVHCTGEDVTVHVPLLGPSLLADMGWSLASAAVLSVFPSHLHNPIPISGASRFQ